jgi:hypothetical protein
MAKNLLSVFVMAMTADCLLSLSLHAQNTSPYWSLAGNSNAAASSKLGTTKSIPLKLITANKMLRSQNLHGR